MLSELIKLFPLIYAIWGGILIAAGVMICLGLRRLIAVATLRDKSVRKSDHLNFIAVSVITVLNVVSLFWQHETMSYVLDALILGHFWCTIYFGSIIYTHLRILPSLRGK